MLQVLLRYPIPDEQWFSLPLPERADVHGIVFGASGDPALIVVVDPEESSGSTVEFFQVGPNEPFDTEGLQFLGAASTHRFVWMKLKRRPYDGKIERVLQ